MLCRILAIFYRKIYSTAGDGGGAWVGMEMWSGKEENWRGGGRIGMGMSKGGGGEWG